jgi:hypothetical protein
VRIPFEKDFGDSGSSAGFPRPHRRKSNASLGAPAFKPVYPCFSNPPLAETKFALRLCLATETVARGKHHISSYFFAKMSYISMGRSIHSTTEKLIYMIKIHKTRLFSGTAEISRKSC